MSDALIFAVAYWLWYFVDGAKFTRRLRFALGGRFARGLGRVTHSGLTRPPFSPWGWHASFEEMPFCFSPLGLCNRPVASVGRPAPVPRAIYVWRWDEIQDIRLEGGTVYINGRPFCPVPAPGGLPMMRSLVDAMKQARSENDRAAALRRRIESWFRPNRLRRTIQRASRATRLVSAANALLTLMAATATAYVVCLEFDLFAESFRERVASTAWGFAAAFGAVHLFGVVEGWRAHRRLMPNRGSARFELFLSAVLLPPHAMRLRAHLSKELAVEAHPMTWITALARDRDFQEYARNCVADLHFPLRGDAGERATEAEAVVGWYREQLSGALDQVLASRGLSSAELLRPPKRVGSDACQYCPRCGAQFVAERSHCPNGIPLQRF